MARNPLFCPVLAVFAILAASPLFAGTTIRQSKWIALGPIQSAGDCWGEIGDPNPTPGRDLLGACPRVGDDWGGREVLFVSRAPTQWTSLTGVIDRAEVNCGLLYWSTPPTGLGEIAFQRVKAAFVTYAVNNSAGTIPIQVCSGSYNESYSLWVNRDLITRAHTCATSPPIECPHLDPALLVPGVNRIVVVTYQGSDSLANWGFSVSLRRVDGAAIDDETDAQLSFTSNPPDCPAFSTPATRSVANLCSGSGTQVTIRGSGEGSANDLIHVVEDIDGVAAVTSISNGGVFSQPPRETTCDASSSSTGIFEASRDIGGPCGAGSAVFEPATGTYTVRGAGRDIWNTGDQFQFTYLRARGDFSISVRVRGKIPTTTQFGKFGIMARQDCTPNSRHASILSLSKDGIEESPDTYAFQTRSVHGSVPNQDSSTYTGGSYFDFAHPRYLRMDRSGSKFTAYVARDDALNWEPAGEADWGADAPCEVLLGLAVCFRTTCSLLEAQFDALGFVGGDSPCGGRVTWDVKRSELDAGLSYDVERRGLARPRTVRVHGTTGPTIIAGPQGIDVGSADQMTGGPGLVRSLDVGGGVGGSTVYDPTHELFTMISSGRDIGDAGDQFQFAFTEWVGDFDLEVEIVNQIEPSPHGEFPAGRIGLMARKSCRGDSKHCHIETPSGEESRVLPTFVSRLIDGTTISTRNRDQFNSAQFEYPDVGQRPRFQRLVRVENTFYAFLSRDGVWWDSLGRDTWQGQSPDEPVLVGFAASSGVYPPTGVSPPTTVLFRVLSFKTPNLDPPLADDGTQAGDEFYFDDFETGTLDPVLWLPLNRNCFWNPQVTSERIQPALEEPRIHRLRVSEEGRRFCGTAVWFMAGLDFLNEAIYEFEFDAFFRNPADSAANGITFTMAGYDVRLPVEIGLPRVGGIGNYMGYEGLGSRLSDSSNLSTNSFAVSLNAWGACCESVAGLGDPFSPKRWHVGIATGNQVENSLAVTSELPEIFPATNTGLDLVGVHFRIRYNRGLVRVWVHRNGTEPPDQPTLETRVLPMHFGQPGLGSAPTAVCGFTGGTGNESMTAEVDNFRITSFPESKPLVKASLAVSVPVDLRVGESFTLDGHDSTAGPGISYAWRVLSGPAEIDGASSGPSARVRTVGSGAPIIVALTVDDGQGDPPPALPRLDQLDLCAPACPSPGYCVTCLPAPFDATCVAVICAIRAPSDIPGPQQIEATLAEGVARFEWFNPIVYDRIRVLDSSGSLVKELQGGESRIEVASLGKTEVALTFWGVDRTGEISDPGRGVARAFGCERPQPLTPLGERGDLELTVYGQHDGGVPCRCCTTHGGGGGGSVSAIGKGGGLGSSLALGLVRTQRALDELGFEPTTLTTGFTLDRDADRLEIAAWYRKILNGPGVMLRAKLRRVGPDSQRDFTDELTFPDVFVKDRAERHAMVYFRGTGDVADPDVASCNLVIPAGDYLLDFYAVGGTRKIAYFGFPDDKRDNEVLVPGAPCPPYPLVEVTDLTGFPTLPTISNITGTRQHGVPGHLPCPGRLAFRFTAEGFWSDGETNFRTQESCAPSCLPFKVNPDFEYVWTVHDQGGQPTEVNSQSTSSLDICLADWGCYRVELVMRSKSCPFEKRFEQEVALIPDDVVYSSVPQFVHPSPDPAGIYAVLALNIGEAAAHGEFGARGPLQFRVLAVPPCPGGCPDPRGVPALAAESIEFRLAARLDVTQSPVSIASPTTRIEDLCGDVPFGPKYFRVTFEDPGKMPDLGPVGEYPHFASVRLEARVIPSGSWTLVGKPMHFTNHPKSLDRTIWTGHYEVKEDAYKFLTKMAEDFQSGRNIGATDPIDLGSLPVKIPSFSNDVTSGFTAQFEMVKSEWRALPAPANLSGEILSNEISGAQTFVQGVVRAPQDAAQRLVEAYSWCKEIPILNNTVEQTLFNAILYTGFVGPIPVTLRAVVGLALELHVNAQVNVDVSPFAAVLRAAGVSEEAPPEQRNFARAFFTLTSSVGIGIPCEIRADILFGIASVAARLIPEAKFILNTQVGAVDAAPRPPRAFVQATLAMYFEVKACLNFLITEICFSPGRIPIIPERPLFRSDAPRESFELVGSCPAPGGGGSQSAPRTRLREGHGGGVHRTSFATSTSNPATAASPDRTALLTTFISSAEEVQLFIKVGGTPVQIEGASTDAVPRFSVKGKFRDPSAAFVSNDRALIAWAYSFTENARGADPGTTAGRNRLAREDEIVITTVEKVDAEKWRTPSSFRMHDRLDEIPDTTSWRADGKPSMAGDPLHGEALVAWVRYETPDFLVVEGTKKVFVPVTDPNTLKVTFEEQTFPNERPQIERTAIYFRRVTFNGALGAPVRISPPGIGINIEPAISVASGGQAAYCVWLHDATPGHKNLFEANRGRSFLYSIWTRSSDGWSEPREIYPQAEMDRLFPTALEPKILLKGESKGLLAFTALETDAPDWDTGLGGNRFVHAARLENGVFLPPARIHGKCLKRVYGVQVYILTDDGNPTQNGGGKPAEYVLAWQGTDPGLGSRESSGNVVASALGEGMSDWSPPVSLTPDENVHSNVAVTSANGVIHSINLNGGPSSLALRGGIGAGSGGGVDDEPDSFFEIIDTPIWPDPAVTSCHLSDPYAGVGAPVKARVTVENLGIAYTPTDAQGRSALELEAVFVRESGEESTVSFRPVPELPPGGSTTLDLALEMPLDPVRVRVQLRGEFLDQDLNSTNNSRECFLGAPTPGDVACESVTLNDEDHSPATRITWSSPLKYDEILLYRDGSMFATTSGDVSSFIDAYTGQEAHVYCVRGRIGVSKSTKAVCVPMSRSIFRRGDSDLNGKIEITDAVRVLGYLFLGTSDLACPDSGDADDNGELEITDAVRILSYLFLGGSEPPAPGPGACGLDPTEDALVSCELACR